GDTRSMSEARAYHRWQLRLGILRLLLTVGYLAALLATGASARLRDLLSAWTSHWWLAVPAAVLVLAAGYQLLTLPLGWLGGFELPRRFGLSHESLGQWLRDRIKGGLIGTVLTIAGALIVYGLLRSTPWWWLWAGAAFAIGGAFLAFVMPIWLPPPLFPPAPPPPCGLPPRRGSSGRAGNAAGPEMGVGMPPQPRRSRTANAAVTGLGRTRRILLFDTLVNRFEPDEVEAVLAHELGHHVAGDVWRGLAVQS